MPYELTLPDGSKILVSDEIPKEEAEKAISTAINMAMPPQQQTNINDVFSKFAQIIPKIRQTPKPPEPPRLSSPFAAQASGKFINDLMNDLRALYQAEMEKYKLAMQEEAQRRAEQLELRREEREQRRFELEQIEKNRTFLLNVLQQEMSYRRFKETLRTQLEQHRDMLGYYYATLENKLKAIEREWELRERLYKDLAAMKPTTNNEISDVKTLIDILNTLAKLGVISPELLASLTERKESNSTNTTENNPQEEKTPTISERVDIKKSFEEVIPSEGKKKQEENTENLEDTGEKKTGRPHYIPLSMMP